jgi:hypothetical protein
VTISCVRKKGKTWKVKVADVVPAMSATRAKQSSALHGNPMSFCCIAGKKGQDMHGLKENILAGKRTYPASNTEYTSVGVYKQKK